MVRPGFVMRSSPKGEDMKWENKLLHHFYRKYLRLSRLDSSAVYMNHSTVNDQFTSLVNIFLTKCLIQPSILLVVVFFTILVSTTARQYVAPEDCIWKTPNPGEDEVLLTCNVMALKSGKQSTNFSLIERDRTTSLHLICDQVLVESHLSNNTFSDLQHLKSLYIAHCKLPFLPRRVFHGLHQLKNLTLHSHSNKWSSFSLKIERESLSSLKSLEILNLGFNNIAELPRSLFCDLSNLKELNLTHNRLQDLTVLVEQKPNSCGKELTKLDISFNNLQKLDRNSFVSLTKLIEINLQKNQLSQIEADTFKEITKLQILDLSSNQLASIPPSVFHHFGELRALYLQNNSLGLLAPQQFSGLQQILALNLSRNAISSEWVTPETLADLIRLVVLDMSHNLLGFINSSTFQSQYSLQMLFLSHNRITEITDNAFASLYNLHTLDLSYNLLKYIDVHTLNGLYVLSFLSLEMNRIDSIHSEGMKNCSNLQDLKLGGNRLDVTPKALTILQFLKSLDLSDNLLASLTNATFVGLKQLNELSLQKNQIGNLTRGIFRDLPSLTYLDLSSNVIQWLEHGMLEETPSIETLLLKDNLLTDINGLFMNLHNLRFLNVSRNQIKWFDYALIPAELRTFDIHDNRVDSLGNYFELESALKLQYLDASFNIITEINPASFPNSIRYLRLNSNRINVIHPFVFMGKENLTDVDLSNNSLQVVDINSFRLNSFPSNKTLPQLHVSGNPFFCDCTMEWLQRINSLHKTRQYPRVEDLDKVMCQLPFKRHATSVSLSKTTPQDFLCQYQSHCFALCHCCEFDACDCEMVCPENCTCYSDQTWNTNIVDCSSSSYNKMPQRIPMDVTDLYLDGTDMSRLSSHSFIGRKNMKVLYLNNSNIHIIHNRTFNGLLILEILHLEHNQLSALQGFEFQNLSMLRELYLSHNHVRTINNVTFVHLIHLEYLFLDNNYITYFQVWILALNPNLKILSLGHNSWTCDCDFLAAFQDWLFLHRENVYDITNIRCHENTTAGPFILTFNVSACGNLTAITIFQAAFTVHDYMPFIIVGCIAFLFIVVIMALLCVYRQEIKIWFYTKYGIRLFHKNHYTPEAEKLFDAFVSYCKKDEAFVAQILAPELECASPQQRLCLRYRDLPMVGYVAEAITEAIECSHRTVVVLSEQFLKNEWCRFELKSAHHETRCNRHHCLVVVLLDNTSLKHMDADTRLCLRSAVVIRWGEKRFWEKLRYSLPDGRGSSKHITCPETQLEERSLPGNSVKLV